MKGRCAPHYSQKAVTSNRNSELLDCILGDFHLRLGFLQKALGFCLLPVKNDRLLVMLELLLLNLRLLLLDDLGSIFAQVLRLIDLPLRLLNLLLVLALLLALLEL